MWYHCVRYRDLLSSGVYELYDFVDYYGLDLSYAGKTILDVGCSDGFFSCLFKERGAARVLGVDSNQYDGSVAISPSAFRSEEYQKKYQSYKEDYNRFASVYERHAIHSANKYLLLAKLKNLDLEFQNGSVYDLSAHGKFDISFCGALLEHLKDPISAIEQLYSATNEKAIISCSSAVVPNFLTKLLRRPLLVYRGHQGGGSFFEISEEALTAMCRAAGFKKMETKGRFYVNNRRSNQKVYHVVIHAYK